MVLSVFVAQHLHNMREDNVKYCNQISHTTVQFTGISYTPKHTNRVDCKAIDSYIHMVVPKDIWAFRIIVTLLSMLNLLFCCQQAFSCCICPCSFVF